MSEIRTNSTHARLCAYDYICTRAMARVYLLQHNVQTFSRGLAMLVLHDLITFTIFSLANEITDQPR